MTCQLNFKVCREKNPTTEWSYYFVLSSPGPTYKPGATSRELDSQLSCLRRRTSLVYFGWLGLAYNSQWLLFSSISKLWSSHTVFWSRILLRIWVRGSSILRFYSKYRYTVRAVQWIMTLYEGTAASVKTPPSRFVFQVPSFFSCSTRSSLINILVGVMEE